MMKHSRGRLCHIESFLFFEPVVGEGGVIEEIDLGVVIQICFVTPAVIKTIIIKPFFRKPLQIRFIYNTIVIQITFNRLH